MHLKTSRNLIIPSLIFFTAAFLIILGVYFVCHLYLQKISQETIQNWLQSERINIQEHNLLSAITKNQRVLLSSEFIKGVALIDLNLDKQNILIEFGEPISVGLTKVLVKQDIKSDDVGIFTQVTWAQIPDQKNLVVAFKIEAQFLRQLFFLVSLGFILLFFVFLSMIFILEWRATNQREKLLRKTLQQFLSDGKYNDQLETNFPDLLRWWRQSKAHFDSAQEKLIEAREHLIFAAKARRVAHDIRLPMRILERVPLRISKGEQTIDEAMIVITQVVSRLDGVTNELLISWQQQINSGLNPPNSNFTIQRESLAVVDIESSIRKLVFEKRNLYDHLKKLEIELIVQAAAITSFAINEVELIRNLSNLIDNAVEAIGLEGRVEIEVSSNRNILKIAIKDNGCGIPLEIIDQIGMSQQSFAKTQGTGTGVFYSRIFARLMGGDLFIDSVEGVGSTFSLVFPLHEELFILSKAKPMAYVDDDLMGRTFWREFICENGLKEFENLIFSDSKSYESWIRDKKGHVLFSDFDLNEKNFDGIDLIAKVTPELGVYQSFLITSTYDDPKLIRRASEAGVRVIPKSRLFEYAIELH